jgi:EAL domain-containing protein (putative c-di-GMP-specific phosphodiesterase class I)
VAVWDEGADQHSSERLSLLGDLRKAVDNDELTLAYQPKVALRGAGGEHYAEALVRWRHPTRGLVAPVEFIPFAEQTGYIRAITQWVLAHAIAQCAEWRFNGLPMNVSINLSTRDLMDATLPDRFAALLQRHRCAAQWIALEITESAILDDPAHAIENLERLNALGCKLAIDDYGTGSVGGGRRRRGRCDPRPLARHGLRHGARLPAQPRDGRGGNGGLDARIGVDKAGERTAEPAPCGLGAPASE